jgi:hypothetical protein
MQFYGNVILYHKFKMFFHLGYRCDGNGRIGSVTCSNAHPQVKALFAWCGGLVPPPLNNMEVPAHILNGQIEDVAMEILNPWMEGEFPSTFQVERAPTFTPPTSNIKGPNSSTNNNTQTFRQVSLLEGLNSTKK